MSHRQVAVRVFRPRSVSRLNPLALAIGGLLAAGNGFAVETTEIKWNWLSSGYVDWAKDCQIANGGTDACTKNPDWDPNGSSGNPSPILSWNDYEDGDITPMYRNRYYDWVNNQGYAFQINSVTIAAAGSVGTNGTTASPVQNTRNIAPGTGISAAWELSSTGSVATMEGARVEIKSEQADGSLASWGLTDNKLLKNPPATSDTPWMPGDLSGSPIATPINKTFASNLDPGKRAIEAGDQVRIQFFQDGGIEEQPSAVLGDLALQFNIATADLTDTSPNKVYARIGGSAQTTSVTVTNNGGFRAAGVAALDPTAAAGNPTGYGFSRSEPIPDPPAGDRCRRLCVDRLYL